jgi:hypothetical protein
MRKSITQRGTYRVALRAAENSTMRNDRSKMVSSSRAQTHPQIVPIGKPTRHNAAANQRAAGMAGDFVMSALDGDDGHTWLRPLRLAA